MIGIVICTYNRPKYLQQCFDSLRRANIPDGTQVIIVDDASTDEETKTLIDKFAFVTHSCITIKNDRNGKISRSLKQGYNLAFSMGCNIVMNLDSDTIVRKDFIDKLLPLHEKFPEHILTGFNCHTRNRNGTERHVVVQTGDGWNMKKSVTGVHMMMKEPAFRKYMEPSLDATMKGGNWDHLTGIASMKDNKPTVCIVPSVVQHIGIESSLGHAKSEPPDVAEDFEMEFLESSKFGKRSLSNITLIGVDCDHFHLLEKVAERCTKEIEFGAVKLLSSANSSNPNHVKIPSIIHSKADYSHFITKRLHEFIETEYALIIQHDGFIVNPSAWSDEFLDYDYVGAPWNWYSDGHDVGNGGFSLRSLKLLKAVANDQVITETHPEDHMICRTYRKYLELTYKLTFAPKRIAEKFSIEAYRNPNRRYQGSFGFHGAGVDFRGSDIVSPYGKPSPLNGRHINGVERNSQRQLVISQFQGLGDIIFSMTIANDFIAEGYEVIWPVVPQYLGIQKHFPQIKFVEKNAFKQINHEQKSDRKVNGMRVIPLRWAGQRSRQQDYRNVMRAKYDMYRKDWQRWREVTWVRDKEAENRLFYDVLKLKDGEPFNLINTKFRTDQTGVVPIEVTNDYRNIEMVTMEEFTLLDWAKVISEATEIHTVGTAINYLMELLPTKAEMHLYVRRPDEKDFSYYDYLLEKQYHFHK